MKLNQLEEKLEEENLDAFVSRENAHYLSGTSAASVVVATPNKSVLLCGRLEYDRAKKESETDEVKAYSKTKVPFRKGEDVIVGKTGKAIGLILEELSVNTVGNEGLGEEILD